MKARRACARSPGMRRGAVAYLRQQYKVVAIVFVVLALFFAYPAYGAGCRTRGALRLPDGGFFRTGRISA
ncbi:MAG: hypothetical protein ACLU5I_06820 [Alistipes finegoldii]